jgi:hypothetical protein
MADYIYQFNGKERGPVSFAELAAQIAAGKVTADSLVRSQDSHDWTAAEDIPGLFRAAKKIATTLPDATLNVATDAANVQPEAKAERTRKTKSNSEVQNRLAIAPAQDPPTNASPVSTLRISPFTILLSLVILGFGLYFGNKWLSNRQRFPSPPTIGSSAGTELPLQDMRVPAPNPPTLDIPVGKPLPVPGLENEYWVSSPTLSHDLKKIVYLKPVGRQDDLYLAQRASKEIAFQKPVRLKCSTAVNEQFCSLSPDGTQLLFTVQEQPTRLYIATSVDDFATSKLVVLTGIDVSMDNVDNAEWLSNTTIKFAVGDPTYTRRSQHVAERSETDGSFVVTLQLPLQNPWPRMWFSAKLERAYFANATGISLTAPKLQVAEFGLGLLLMDAATIGPIDEAMDDPVFVVPQEDIVFYSGSGSVSGKVPAPRLWMIRF